MQKRENNPVMYAGIEYASWLDLCFSLRIPYTRVFYYVHKGMSKREAIEMLCGKSYDKKVLPVKDHKGRIFRTMKHMVEAYNIPLKEFQWRQENGQTLEESLVTPYRRSFKFRRTS